VLFQIRTGIRTSSEIKNGIGWGNLDNLRVELKFSKRNVQRPLIEGDGCNPEPLYFCFSTVVFHLYAVQLYAVFEENCEKLSSENFPIICRILDKIFILTEKLLSSY
jgi:hypothetical protein